MKREEGVCCVRVWVTIKREEDVWWCVRGERGGGGGGGRSRRNREVVPLPASPNPSNMYICIYICIYINTYKTLTVHFGSLFPPYIG